MRRLSVAGSCLILVVAIGVVIVSTASSAARRPDLTVSNIAEPPQAAAAATRFRQSFAVVNQGNRRGGSTVTRFFLDKTPRKPAGRVNIGQSRVGALAGGGEQNKRASLRIPAGLAADDYYLVACADIRKAVREAREQNNCRVSGQPLAVGGSIRGPAGPSGAGDEIILDRVTLPIGRPTIEGFNDTRPGDDEFSDQRRLLAAVGPVGVFADCKRTTNGDNAAPDDPFTSANNFDQDGDEAKILVYTSSGTVTFNGPGNSSHRNIGPGFGESDDESDADGQAEDTDGGEGAHTAIAAARDPEQDAPEEDWAFAYKVGSIYVNHSNGTEFVFTGYAGIDVVGAEDQCVFSGVVTKVKTVG